MSVWAFVPGDFVLHTHSAQFANGFTTGLRKERKIEKVEVNVAISQKVSV